MHFAMWAADGAVVLSNVMQAVVVLRIISVFLKSLAECFFILFSDCFLWLPQPKMGQTGNSFFLLSYFQNPLILFSV